MGDNTFLMQTVFQEAIDKMIAKMGKIRNKIDNEVSSFRMEIARLSSSLNNIYTLVLEKQGHFSSIRRPLPNGQLPSTSSAS